MNTYFHRFLEWLLQVLTVMFDVFLSMLGLVKVLEILRRELGES